MRTVVRSVLCLLVLTACLPLFSQERVKVSLVQLIATPDRFDGKAVEVKGFLEMDWEGALLYLHQADADNAMLSNAIWVRVTGQMKKDEEKLNKKYVTVRGKFHAGFKEQLGNPLGGIPEVEKVEFWSDPANPLSQRLRQMPGRSENQ